MRRLAKVLLVLTTAIGCGRSDVQRNATAATETRLVVFAAASLQASFNALAQRFEETRPGVEVALNFAGSQELRTQLEHGAKADVFASADTRNMDDARRLGLVREPWIFARNEPVIVVGREVPGAVESMRELPQLTRIVLGAPEVPIGRYSEQILERAGAKLGADFKSRVLQRVVSREFNVKQALARVTLGEAEAAIVYRTDALTVSGKVKVVEIPAEFNVNADYPVAEVAVAEHPRLAGEWLAFLRSPAAQSAIAALGFIPVVAVSQ